MFENVKQKRLEEDLMPSCGEGGNSAKKRRKERREQEGRQVGRVPKEQEPANIQKADEKTRRTTEEGL